MEELILEYHVKVSTPEGLEYMPRSYAAQTGDGSWAAWLEFDPVDPGSPILRTERETTQSSRRAVEAWAAGLEPVYFRGAFERAHIVSG